LANVRISIIGRTTCTTSSTRYPTAFATDAAGATVLNGPGINNWDLGLQKTLGIAREAAKLHLRTERFNAWNHAQFLQPNGNAGAGVNFGRISAALPPRLIQIAMKLQW
jgi:hypothetical protein